MRRLRIGINGFGRIGRVIFRLAHKYNLFDVVLINDIYPDKSNLVYQLKFDSIWGKFPGVVTINESGFAVDNRNIAVTHESSLPNVPWEKHGVDVVVDSAGAKWDLPSIETASKQFGHYINTHWTPELEKVKTVIFGVNEHTFDPLQHRILSSSICDAIALGPIIALLSNQFGIHSGFLTTLHPWLSYQHLMDGHAPNWSHPDDQNSNYSLGRAAPNNLIVKSTTAILATEVLFPALANILESVSYRIPTNIVSSATLNIKLNTSVGAEDVIAAMNQFERVQQNKILAHTYEPMVSIDYLGEEHSVVVDHRWTKVNKDFVLRLVYFYDNEWGYSSRVLDLIRIIADTV
jgi:glyceraldehyde 3-phosphate dehydrogenase